ncbi:hypothetical protein [Pedobacter sp. Leaf194]|uniref:hypothetical protein n=1 Tax=Pedobacter sp. Leaf194 TaxID=1736297 RepID=UPI000702828A|nr:hypothetical protein [Pedobacter sp. Leaf194]KQS39827.1 hypothetical protein ASG14_19340 [Pedobacter sp. Leaf194]
MEKSIISTICLIILIFSACKTEPDSSAVKKELLNIHDKLMLDGEKVVKNRMALDSLLKSGKIKDAKDSTELADLITGLNKADENMMDWMHFFKDDFKGKDEKEALTYYKSEMVKIRGVEDNYIKVTRTSDSLLKIYNVKPFQKPERHKH